MRPRSQTNTNISFQDNAQDTASEESISVPPGTVLQLVDQDDDMPERSNIRSTNQADNSVQQATDHSRHRYPQTENCERPIRYRND